MPSPEDEPVRDDLARWRIEELCQLVLRALVLVQFGLILASLAVPLLGRNPDPGEEFTSGDYGRDERTFRLIGGLRYLLTKDQLKAERTHPLSVRYGVDLSIVGLIVLLVLLVLSAVVAYGLAHPDSLRAPLITVAAVLGIALVLCPVLLAVTQIWLSNDEVATPLQPGLGVPVGAGVGMLLLSRVRRALEGLLTRS